MNRVISKISQYLQEFWRYRDLLKLLVEKSVKLKYRRSVLGYIWSVLNPLMIMVVMTLVFSTMFNRNIENFPVYLFCGQLLFNFMKNSTEQAISSITGNAALLKKSYVPKYIFTLARITGSLVDLVFSLAALLIVMIATGTRFTFYMLLFPLVLVQLYVFCVGLGLFLAQANVFFRDTQFIYGAALTAWRYLTPIFYPMEMLPERLVWCIEHLNPMYFYVRQFRDLIHMGCLPSAQTVLAGCVTAVLMLLIGLCMFMRSRDKFILHI